MSKYRNYRQRRKHGVCILQIPVDHLALASALVANGRCTADETMDRAKVAAITTRLIEQYCAAWNDAGDDIFRHR